MTCSTMTFLIINGDKGLKICSVLHDCQTAFRESVGENTDFLFKGLIHKLLLCGRLWKKFGHLITRDIFLALPHKILFRALSYFLHR